MTDMNLDRREQWLKAVGAAEIRCGHQDQAGWRGTTDHPSPAGIYCTVDMGDGRRFGGNGTTKDEARAAAFSNAESALGLTPGAEWAVIDQEPKLLHDKADEWAWRWRIHNRAGEKRFVIAGLTDTVRATIEAGGGPVTSKAREAYRTRGRSLIEAHLDDQTLPRRRIIA